MRLPIHPLPQIMPCKLDFCLAGLDLIICDECGAEKLIFSTTPARVVCNVSAAFSVLLFVLELRIFGLDSKATTKSLLSLDVISQCCSGTDINTCNVFSLLFAGKKYLRQEERAINSCLEISCANTENKQTSVPLDSSPQEEKIFWRSVLNSWSTNNHELWEITTAPLGSCSPSVALSQILTFFSFGLTSFLSPWVFLHQIGVCSSQISSSEEAKKFSRVCETVLPLTNRDSPSRFWRRKLTE